MTEASANFILAQQRALKLMLTKRADARSRGETPPGFNEYPPERYAPWWRQRVRTQATIGATAALSE